MPKQKTTWREIVKSYWPKTTFRRAATTTQLNGLEKALKVKLPADLSAILLEANGMGDWLMPINEIIAVNKEYRTDPVYREIYSASFFDDLLFFANDGTGSFFGYLIHNGRCDTDSGIIYWCHETDEREPYAPSLKGFLEKHLRRS